MGAVYRATELASGRGVALKLLHGVPNPAQRERFRREADVAASLEHPGIVPVHNVGEAGGRPFIVYGLIDDAAHLDDAFRSRDLPARVELVLQAARALAYAHGRGVVHRDVKPENLLVDAHGRVRVADFGLARVDDGRHLTRTGAVLGTPTHMAPEQFAGRPVEATADVWALGVVLFQALTLSLPFEGQNLVELQAQQVGADRSPRSRDPQVPRALDQVCRQADAGALAEDLTRALRGERVHASSVAGGPSARRLRWGLALVPALLVLGVGLWASRPSPSAPSPAARPRASSPAPAQPAAARAPGWDLRRGDRFEVELGWTIDRDHDDPDAPSDQFELALRGDAEVVEVAPSFVNLAIEVTWTRLRAGALVSTPDRSHFLLPVAGLVGQTFHLHLEQPSGRVRRVLGVRALRDRLLEGVLPEARGTLTQALNAFTDVSVERHMNMVSLGPPAPDALTTGWSREVAVWPTEDCGVTHPVRVSPGADGSLRFATREHAPVPGSAGRIDEPLLEGSVALGAGLITAADARHVCRLTSPRQAFAQTLVVRLRARWLDD